MVPLVYPVEAYVASLNMLAQFRQEVDHLLRAACEANLEFRQELGETHAAARDSGRLSPVDERFLAALGAQGTAVP